eukprot:TRINITY_DN8458_c0_g1_i2.p1 TRINITY_DN8458_c0_g1~~TRINITY_DN8458_c0_g1_i2.p1  ORF type:complete len:552 (-),score=116.42 TRINITY_DN8458_c0_g1_i2:27-1682(-)
MLNDVLRPSFWRFAPKLHAGSIVFALCLLELRSPSLHVARAADLTCDGGFSGLPREFFTQLDEWQKLYKRDSLTRSREFLYGLYERKVLPQLQENVQVCPAAVLEIMMNSVLASWVDYSPADGEALYHLTRRLANELSPQHTAVRELVAEWEEDTVRIYPFLFGLRSHDCYNSSIKVYVYEVPENLTHPALECVNGQWGTEVLFHKFFLNGACRTLDPGEADFFYVPVYGTCLWVRGDVDSDETAASRLWDPLVNFLAAQPWFTRRRQMDHIFLFADGQSARLWDSYDLVRSESIFLMTESKCPTWDEPMRRYADVKACSSGWKDVIIPGHTDHFRVRAMLQQNRPSEERDLLLTFHGRHPGNNEVYAKCQVRADVMALDGLDGVDVGGSVDDYFERKGRAHFCLIPGGTSPWTNHLYESFFCGCIPVILSDEYEVAFQHEIAWPSLSIKWPEAKVDQLYDHLRSYSAERLREMKEEVDRQACWFDYFSDNPRCSPYLAVLRQLEERKRNFPAHFGRFWNADEALKTGGSPAVPPARTTRFHSREGEAFVL